MHIPDGFLDLKTAAVTSALAATGLTVAIRQVNRTLPRHKIPLMGLTAAFVFAAQMLNFPVGGGTSGHLLGGVLTSVLLGPAAAAVVIASVLIVQCLLFSDGGLLALGANIFNMALVATMSGYAIYRLVHRVMGGLRGRVTAILFASWCSTVLASLACAGELALSGTASGGVVFPAMTGVHMFIGIGEGIITGLVALAILRVRPDLFDPEHQLKAPTGRVEFLLFGLVIALGLALFVAPFASSWPDGLEKVAASLGFEGRATTVMKSIIPDYKMPGIGSEAIATSAAGALGTLVMFAIAWALGWLMVRHDSRRHDAE